MDMDDILAAHHYAEECAELGMDFDDYLYMKAKNRFKKRLNELDVFYRYTENQRDYAKEEELLDNISIIIWKIDLIRGDLEKHKQFEEIGLADESHIGQFRSRALDIIRHH